MPYAKKTIAARAAALVLAALLAVGAELLLTRVDSAENSGRYVTSELSADVFERSELEAAGGGRFKTLAKNSFFSFYGVGGVPVRTIDVRLTRESFDETETVVYFYGVKNGVEGEFMSVLAKEGDGVYSAVIDAENVVSLRIYPTEKLHSTISFDGVTVNPTLPPQGFSVGRAAFFALAAAAVLNAACLVLRALKKDGRRSCWVEVYWILCGVTAAVGYMAAGMFTAARGMRDLLVPVLWAVFSLLYLFLWLTIRKIESVERKLAVVVFAAGCLFAFATAPLQVPDEHAHFLRAWAVSQGRLGFDGYEAFPREVELLISNFPGEFYSRLQATGEADVVSRIENYGSEVAEGVEAGSASFTSVQLIFPYIPAAAAIAVTRLFTRSALVCLYAARVANVAIFAFCAYVAMRWAKRYRGMLILFSLMPLTLFMVASLSYDSMLLSAVLIFFGIIFKDDISTRDIVVLAVAFGAIVSIKPIYLPLALAVFAIPSDSVRGKRPRIGLFALTLAVGLLAYAAAMLYAGIFAENIAPVEKPAGTNIAGQMMYVISNPIRYVMVMLVDGYMNRVFYLGYYGDFGWLDVTCWLTGLFTVPAAVTVAGMYSDDARLQKRSDVWIFTAITLLGYAVVVTGFYCVWSTLGSTSILGVQPRYFLPLWPAITAALARVMSGFMRGTRNEPKRDITCVYLCGILAAASAAELAVQYFLT